MKVHVSLGRFDDERKEYMLNVVAMEGPDKGCRVAEVECIHLIEASWWAPTERLPVGFIGEPVALWGAELGHISKAESIRGLAVGRPWVNFGCEPEAVGTLYLAEFNKALPWLLAYCEDVQLDGEHFRAWGVDK